MKMISVFGSKVGSEEIAAVTAVMESQWMGFGKKVEEFEKKFSAKYGVEHFAMVDSGSNALYLSCVLLDLPKGSEIILPSFTWVSCAQAIIMAGHQPVFCDVDPDTMNVTAEHIKAKINARTSAIMVVHYAGKPVDMDPILALGYPVIEDAAHAVHSTYKGKHCGTIGDVGIYSFDAVKNLTTGEGGGVAVRAAGLLERARMLRYCGIGKSGFDSAKQGYAGRWWEYRIAEPFIKMLPTNLAASIGIVQLDKIDAYQSYRKKIWDRYTEAFAGRGIICPSGPGADETHSWFTYVIRTPGRDALAKYLFDNGVYTTLRYHPLHLNSLYGKQASLPNCELLNEEALSIPLHPNLKEEEVELIIELILKF
jgi:dTDP-4-amino-4,6-dideoxygalactose transaminase